MSETLHRGTIVRLSGLSGQPELNGQHGLVLKWEVDRERYGVRVVVDGVSKRLALKRVNLLTRLDEGGWTSLGRLPQDAVAAHKAGEHELALALFTECTKVNADDKVAHSNRAASLIALSRCEEALEAANICIKLDHSYPKGHLRRATALEALGRKSEALDALLSAPPVDDPALVAMSERLRVEGGRDGWLRESRVDRAQAAFRLSQPHCATCLAQTAPGRPPPDACCGTCGMVQYCCAAHKRSDSLHRAFCGKLQAIAWRQLWCVHLRFDTRLPLESLRTAHALFISRALSVPRLFRRSQETKRRVPYRSRCRATACDVEAAALWLRDSSHS